MTLAAAGVVYLAVGFTLWAHAWAQGATTHTLCGCGDPALFLWFFQWPATAIAHGQNPFYSTALFHPGGINLLAQTSVPGLSLPLVPVTWIWGPVASFNVASTVAPALTAFTAFVVLRRWAPWTPAAFVGGLLYGFSPFVLNSLQFAHLMTAALMLLPLILAVLDEILSASAGARCPGLLLALLLVAQFFLSTELLAIAAVVVVVCILALVAPPWSPIRPGCGARPPCRPGAGRRRGRGRGAVGLAGLVRPGGPGPPLGPRLAQHLEAGWIPAFELRDDRLPLAEHRLPRAGRVRGASARLGRLPGLGLPGRAGRRRAGLLAGPPALVLRFRLRPVPRLLVGRRPGQWEPARVFLRIPLIENVIEQRFMAFGYLAAAVMLAIILDRVHRAMPDWRGVVGALAATGVALVPMGGHLRRTPALRHAGRGAAALVQRGGPALPPGRVLLSFPAPFSGVQSAMAWQAVNAMHYSQAGGGGPQGVERRAGSAAAGFRELTVLGFGVGEPAPKGTSSELAAVRHALAVWQVNTVVIAADPSAPTVEKGRDPTYAAAFMTAALGRLPSIEAEAWVWNDVQLGLPAPWRAGRHAALVRRGVHGGLCPGRGEPGGAGLRRAGARREPLTGAGAQGSPGKRRFRVVGRGGRSTGSGLVGRPRRGRVRPVRGEEDGAEVTGLRVRSLLGAACGALACLALPALGPAGAAPVARADASGGSRLAVTLPPGLSSSEHAALERSGAYGPRPMRLLIVGDSIAMTLGEGLSVRSASAYGITVSDRATLGCDLDPQLEVLTVGHVGAGHAGLCELWRGLWPFLTPQRASAGRCAGPGPLGGGRPPARRALGARRRAGLGRST